MIIDSTTEALDANNLYLGFSCRMNTPKKNQQFFNPEVDPSKHHHDKGGVYQYADSS